MDKPGTIKLTKNNYRRLLVKGQVTSPAVQKPTEHYWMSNHGLKRLEVLAFSHHFFHFCHKGFCAYPKYNHLQSGQNVLQLDIPNIVPVPSMRWIRFYWQEITDMKVAHQFKQPITKLQILIVHASFLTNHISSYVKIITNRLTISNWAKSSWKFGLGIGYWIWWAIWYINLERITYYCGCCWYISFFISKCQ